MVLNFSIRIKSFIQFNVTTGGISIPNMNGGMFCGCPTPTPSHIPHPTTPITSHSITHTPLYSIPRPISSITIHSSISIPLYILSTITPILPLNISPPLTTIINPTFLRPPGVLVITPPTFIYLVLLVILVLCVYT